MNRRRFLQSLAALVSAPAMPALSVPSLGATAPSAAAVPANARFWAIYMSGLHGDCSPQALQNMLNIPASEAKNYVTQLVAEGVIKPNPLLKRTVSQLVKTDDQSVFDKIKRRFDMKAEADDDRLEREAVEEPVANVSIDEVEDADSQPVELAEDAGHESMDLNPEEAPPSASA